MDCLLTLWQLLIPCSLGNGCYTLGFLIFIIDERNLLYYSLSTHRKIIKAPLLHQNSGPRVLLSLSPFLRLIPWSAETHLAHSPAWASKTISRRHPVPSPHLERAPGAFVRDASPVSRTLLVFCVNQGVSASFSLSLYRCLGTVRCRSIKGPQQCQFNFVYSLAASL